MRESDSRYEVLEPIASGGMGSVHLGRIRGAAGFVGVVAIKRLSRQLSADPRFRQMLIDEAKLSGRVRHPNVVATLDFIEDGGELCLVMEYAHGVTLSTLASALRARGEIMPLPIAIKIMTDVLAGLAAAHDARGDSGEPLDIIHRDISPQNVVVGFDGQARVLDFGIAHATERHERTQSGELKGKLSYLAPEQLEDGPIDRRLDIYAVGLVLWELLAGRRARPTFTGDAIRAALSAEVEPLCAHAPHVPANVTAVVMRALSREPSNRYARAGDMASELLAACPPASALMVGPWVSEVAPREFESKERALHRAQLAPTSDRPTIPEIGPAKGAAGSPDPSPHALTPRPSSTVGHPRGWMFAGAFAIAAAVIVVGLRVRRHTVVETPIPSVSAAAVSTQPAPPAAPVALESAAPSPTAAPPADDRRASAPHPAARTTTKILPALVQSAVPAPSMTGTTCSPPYTIDAQGTKIPKSGCY